ncbi:MULTISPECIES: hypothetical protein [unclassified Lentilitoribacter]|jgi:hypothetical protein|uniref:hypothetical protein n=1 Tax=unclassified Lentilitoribacter TaxID=2647570 RepID=UPI0013A6C412|nr:hypothetical protein [Lentilitoribacter sp. Alg239-R112]
MSNYSQNIAGDLQEPLTAILNRVGTELRDVAILIERLEPMLENEDVASNVDATEHMKLLQGIDLAVQKSRGLADFLESMSDEVDVEQLVDVTTALNLITLSDLKQRLSSPEKTMISADAYEKASGDLDFF